MSVFKEAELRKYVPGNLSRLLSDIDAMPKVARVALVAEASPTAGGLASWQNPYDEAVTVLTILNVTTPATGVATADIGVDDGGDVSDDTLHDAVDIGTAAISQFSGTGTNGVLVQSVPANEYVVATASADSSGIVGTLFVVYFKTTEPADRTF